MRPQRPKRRTVRVGFRLTRAEKAQIRQCAQKGELFSETCRRLLLVGARTAAPIGLDAYRKQAETNAGGTIGSPPWMKDAVLL